MRLFCLNLPQTVGHIPQSGMKGPHKPYIVLNQLFSCASGEWFDTVLSDACAGTCVGYINCVLYAVQSVPIVELHLSR